MGKYCFKHEYKLGQNSRSLQHCEKITICKEARQSSEKNTYFRKKNYVNNNGQKQSNMLLTLPIADMYMLISYGTLIHGYPGARDGIKSVFAIPKPYIIFYDRIRV